MNKNISILKMSILQTAKPNVVNICLSLYKKCTVLYLISILCFHIIMDTTVHNHLETKFTHFITINVFAILFNSYFHSLFYIFYNQLAGISYTFKSNILLQLQYTLEIIFDNA